MRRNTFVQRIKLGIPFIFVILIVTTLLCVNVYAVQTNRLWGNDRYATAVAISQYGWQQSDSAIIAYGENFPDALSASVLAGKYNIPILLTENNVLSTYTKNELIRLKVKFVYIIGGTGAVNINVENQILSMGIATYRYYGNDRYETAIDVAKQITVNNGIVVTSGEDFSDALSVSPIAGKLQMPIILVPKDDIPQSVKDYISNTAISKTYVLGGTDIISDAVANKFPNVQRIVGNDKYEKNINIIKAFNNKLSTIKIFISSGDNFPDALAGSALAASKYGRIIFIDPSSSALPKPVAHYLGGLNTAGIYPEVVAFGGCGVVSDEILNNSCELTFGIVKENNICSIEDVNVTIPLGQDYTLPSTVQAKLYNSDTIEVPVRWNPSTFDANIIGTSAYNGIVDGYSKAIKISVTIDDSDSKIRDAYLNKKVEDILSKIITPDMNDLRKELAIHDYLVKNTKYDYGNFLAGTIPYDSFTVYGVLVKGTGVCQGYAEAVNLLLNKAGVESTLVSGTANGVGGWGGHAWNIVKIDGKYYHLDVTWDDPVPDRGGDLVGHQYFNLTDDEISIDHEWDKAGVHICNTEFPLKDILRECLINGEYLYYHDDTSIYRVKLDGVFKIETIKSFDCPVQLFRMDGDWLYVSQRSSIFPIRKLKLDGSQYTIIKDNRLNNEALDNFYVKDGWIYMVLLKKIVKASNDGTIVQDLVVVPEDKEIWVDWAVGLYNGWIYYYINDGNEFMRYKVNIDGTENIQINKGEL